MSTLSSPQPLGLAPSFGYGDRLGLATPGHLQAHREHAGPMQPIFAQQSIREMARTGRTPQQVLGDAQAALEAASFDGTWGADADHLKTTDDVDHVGGGFTFFTIDPSDHVDTNADTDDEHTLRGKYQRMRGELPWAEPYRNRNVQIDDGPLIQFDEPTLLRALVKYGRAIAHTIRLGEHIQQNVRDHEIEVSVDETPHPTTPAEHFLIAEQLLRSGVVRLVSIAPRFIGHFEKGIDYKGDLAALEKSLHDHAAIARQLGPYKLSLHSGSDKLSMYEIFARATRGRFHVKTAGTSYLEALRVVARHDASLFRQIIQFARGRFGEDRATYHISAELDHVPPADEVADNVQLEKLYLNGNDGRQILHVTFGSVLQDEMLGPALRAVLIAEPDTHRQLLAAHFGQHLEALRRGM